MTKFNAWPSGFAKAGSAFNGIAFDGNDTMWLGPNADAAILSIRTMDKPSTAVPTTPAPAPTAPTPAPTAQTQVQDSLYIEETRISGDDWVTAMATDIEAVIEATGEFLRNALPDSSVTVTNVVFLAGSLIISYEAVSKYTLRGRIRTNLTVLYATSQLPSSHIENTLNRSPPVNARLNPPLIFLHQKMTFSLVSSKAVIVLAVLLVAIHGMNPLDCPFEQSPDGLLAAIMAMGNVGPGTVMFDLGSGDGKVVMEAAARGAHATGIEFREKLVVKAQVEAERRGLSSLATFRSENFFEADLTSANLIFMYLLPDILKDVGPMLFATLKPGTVIISHDYGLKDYQEYEEWSAEGFAEKKRIAGVTTAYLFKYVVPKSMKAGKVEFQGKLGMPFAAGSVLFTILRNYTVAHTVVFTRRLRLPGGAFEGTLHVIGENNTYDKVWLRGAMDAHVPVLGYMFVDAKTGRTLRAGRTVTGSTRFELFSLPAKQPPLHLKVMFFLPKPEPSAGAGDL